MLAIIDYLHTATLACSRAFNSHNACTPSWLVVVPLCLRWLCVSAEHKTGAARACLQCVSVSVSLTVRGKDGKAPCEHITLTGIWPLSFLPSQEVLVRPLKEKGSQYIWKGLREMKISYRIGNYTVWLLKLVTSYHKI